MSSSFMAAILGGRGFARRRTCRQPSSHWQTLAMATITADLTTNYQVDISNGRLSWRADEPVDVGGDDTGPSPYELLLGALAACTCLTIAMYARRKGMAFDSVSAQFTYDKVHADDCAFCDDDATGYIDTVSSQIFIEGTFTDDERTRLTEIATRCPVHKTLERGITFNDNVVVG
jgi:putative redox protein